MFKPKPRSLENASMQLRMRSALGIFRLLCCCVSAHQPAKCQDECMSTKACCYDESKGMMLATDCARATRNSNRGSHDRNSDSQSGANTDDSGDTSAHQAQAKVLTKQPRRGILLSAFVVFEWAQKALVPLCRI